MNLINNNLHTENMPDNNGCFGSYGGSYIPQNLEAALNEIKEAYQKVSKDPNFVKELKFLNEHYTGRPSPVYFAERLTDML